MARRPRRACPHCHRSISVNRFGVLRTHNDPAGGLCQPKVDVVRLASFYAKPIITVELPEEVPA